MTRPNGLSGEDGQSNSYDHGFGCYFCPMIIKPMQDALSRVIDLSLYGYSACMSRENAAILEILQIATVEPSAAGHMARGAGGVYSFMRQNGFSEELQQTGFWALPGHDEGKVTKRFFHKVGWLGQPIEGYLDEVPEEQAPGTKAFQPNERGIVLKALFAHIRHSPLGTRILHECLSWPTDQILRLRLVVGPLHHLIGSGMPSLVEDDQGVPHISQLVYHLRNPEDRDLVEQTAHMIIRLASEVGSMDELKSAMGQSEVHMLAGVVSMATLIDIIDALHQRPYLKKPDPTIDEVRSVLGNSRLPAYLQRAGVDWYDGFGGTGRYYETVLYEGWERYASPIILRHAQSHSEGEVCAFTDMVEDIRPRINRGFQVATWADRIIYGNSLHRAA